MMGIGRHFRQLDQSGDGILDKQELLGALKTYRLQIPQQVQMWYLIIFNAAQSLILWWHQYQRAWGQQDDSNACTWILLILRYNTVCVRKVQGRIQDFVQGGGAGHKVNRGGCNPQNQRKTLQNRETKLLRGGCAPPAPPWIHPWGFYRLQIKTLQR
jgi:hypothetical protein